MTASKSILGNYEFNLSQLPPNFSMIFKVGQPTRAIHKHKQNMLISGEMTISIDEYSTTIVGGDSANFTPRAGLTPFPANTLTTMTAVTVCKYLCVTYLPGNALDLSIYTSPGGIQIFPINSLVVATEPYTTNGVEVGPGSPTLVLQNTIIEIPAGAKIGVFEPV